MEEHSMNLKSRDFREEAEGEGIYDDNFWSRVLL